jgi:hypothetical protein
LGGLDHLRDLNVARFGRVHERVRAASPDARRARRRRTAQDAALARDQVKAMSPAARRREAPQRP